MLNNDTLNQQYKAFPKMAFYAIEPQENIFWRTLNWMVNDPNGNNGANGPDVGYFEANDDWRLLDTTLKNIIGFYEGMCVHYHKQYQMGEIAFQIGLGTYGPMWNGLNDIYRFMCEADMGMNAWGDGLAWFKSVDAYWKVVIGASVMDTIILKIPLGLTLKIPIPVEVDPYNDGVVMAESAKNLPGAKYNPVKICPNEDKTVDINKGSTHMQVRNDAGLKEALFNLFEGNYYWWFRVFPQQ